MYMRALVALLTCIIASQALAETPQMSWRRKFPVGLDCGPIKNNYGPFDYNDPVARAQPLVLVEGSHFTPDIENLRRGKRGSIGSDIDYTLRAFPNHYRALDAMMRLAVRDRTPQPEGATYTVNCYFDRAVRFRPHDGVVRLMFGLFYYRNGDLKNAIVQGSLGDELTPNNPNIKYNLGLFYFQAKEYEKALSYAQQAQLLGTKLPGLKRKLVKIGKWLEPVAVTGKPPAPTIDQATASTDSAGVRAKSAAEPAKASVPADAAAGLPAQSAKGAAGAPPPSASR